MQIDPVNGTVAFGSIKSGWAFTIENFAKVYSYKFKIDIDKMKSKLWGDNYFDTKAKKWKNNSTPDDNS